MSEKLEKLLENIKMYLGVITILLVYADAIVVAQMYDKYGAIILGYDTTLNYLGVAVIIATIVVAVVYIILCIILRKQQGERYTSCWELIETLVGLLFPSFEITPLETYQNIQWAQSLNLVENKQEMKATLLWKKAARGIRIWNLIVSIFLFSLGSGIVYVVIDEWKSVGDQRALSTVLGAAFTIVLYFWGVVCACGIKKHPNNILRYMICNEISYMTLNEDFSQAKKYGNEIYMGEQYLFVGTGRGMEVVALKDITECNVYRMGGYSSRRLFLSYYILHVVAEGNTFIKYGIIPYPFYKLKNTLKL